MNFKKTVHSFCLVSICVLSLFISQAQTSIKPVTLQVDLTKKTNEPLKPIWAFFGYDEPNYTYMKDGKKLLSELASLSPVPVFVRTHHLLVTGDGTASLKWGSTNAYTEDANGNPIYNWKIVDSIFDTYLQRGMKPLAQIGFMPEALSSNPLSDGFQVTPTKDTLRHYMGWSYPPKDYKKWAALVYEWVKHCVAKYGKAEVESWYWELWNEPDISYWRGTMEEYIKLYDYTADAAKRALPTIRIGGPETTNPGSGNAEKFLRTFLEHVVNGKNYVTGKKGSPLDFITFHAKGQPRVINDTVWMNVGVQLRHIDKGFQIVSSFPTLKNLPIIIGESDPEGCAGCPADIYPNNDYRNGTLYASYTAASFPREYEMAKNRGVNLLGALTWAFEFENQPWFRGFRDLATNGVDKPVLNVFRMFGQMEGNRVPVISNASYNYTSVRDSSVRGSEPDVNGIATGNNRSAAVMVWNYHDKNALNVPATPVTVSVKGISSQKVLITHYRVDQEHGNSYTTWQKMGSPQNPTEEQIAVLQKAGQLEMLGSPQWVSIKNGAANIEFDLPRQGVSLIKISW
ncbi:MAG: beta-xylosidase [Bacteroidia bacterium]|nr:beta-xylosidase [Bacteroidia bacterium]